MKGREERRKEYESGRDAAAQDGYKYNPITAIRLGAREARAWAIANQIARGADPSDKSGTGAGYLYLIENETVACEGYAAALKEEAQRAYRQEETWWANHPSA